MRKLVCALFLVIAAAQYAGPVTPFAHCADGQAQECADTDCSDRCALCTCALDRPAALGAAWIAPPHAHPAARLRPLPQDAPASPPAAEILHVPRLSA